MNNVRLVMLLLSTAIVLIQPTTSMSSAKNGDRFYVDKSGDRLARYFRDSNRKSRCAMYGDRVTIANILAEAKQEFVITLNADSMTEVLDRCSRMELPRFIGERRGVTTDRELNIIFPGTKWCGPGNLANGPDDFGPEIEADRCCQGHDHCDDHIAVGEEKHGILNSFLGTMSNCECDDTFRRCLHDAGTKVATKIGMLFFTALGVPCYKEEHPIVKCLAWGGTFVNQCQEYQLDQSKPKVWQVFDSKIFTAPFDD